MTITTKIGFGPKVNGDIVVLGVKDPVGSRDLNPEVEGKIVLFLTSVSREILEKASFLGVCGVVVPSIHFRDYEYFAKHGEFTLLVLCKFGMLSAEPELIKKLSPLSGKRAELAGEEKTLTV